VSFSCLSELEVPNIECIQSSIFLRILYRIESIINNLFDYTRSSILRKGVELRGRKAERVFSSSKGHIYYVYMSALGCFINLVVTSLIWRFTPEVCMLFVHVYVECIIFDWYINLLLIIFDLTIAPDIYMSVWAYSVTSNKHNRLYQWQAFCHEFDNINVILFAHNVCNKQR